MSRIGLIAFATAFLLTGGAYAADEITLACSGNWLAGPTGASFSGKDRMPVSTSLVIDLDKKTITDTGGIGCQNPSCPITEVTDTYIRFKDLETWQGGIDRVTGALTVYGSIDRGGPAWTIYDLTCKPAKTLF
jgi:hypothetical protein